MNVSESACRTCRASRCACCPPPPAPHSLWKIHRFDSRHLALPLRSSVAAHQSIETESSCCYSSAERSFLIRSSRAVGADLACVCPNTFFSAFVRTLPESSDTCCHWSIPENVPADTRSSLDAPVNVHHRLDLPTNELLHVQDCALFKRRFLVAIARHPYRGPSHLPS